MKELLLSYEGRIGRKSYWMGTLLLGVIAFVLIFACIMLLGIFGALEGNDGLIRLLSLPFFYPAFALMAKRCHDHDKSGWWSLVSLIPLVGSLAALVWFGCMRGTVGANRYGEDPVAKPAA